MPRLAGVEAVNPGVELCKSFGMLVELGGGGVGHQVNQRERKNR